MAEYIKIDKKGNITGTSRGLLLLWNKQDEELKLDGLIPLCG
jgi:hypothetical protein